jgi:hypothetical protein
METIGELMEKLVIANIKLWMVKDGQTALACRDEPVLEEVRQELAQLARTEALGGGDGYSLQGLQVFLKRLDEIRALKPDSQLAALRQLVKKDIELCEMRATLRKAINERLGDHGPTDTVKKYGHRP